MTEPNDEFDDLGGGPKGAEELFDVRSHQDHLLIVKLWDEVSPVVTERCPTGYVTRNGREWPNNALRASVVDLDMDTDDGVRGRIYPRAMILTGLLIAELKHKVGKTLLLVWRQKDPSDKSSPYSVWDMKTDPGAVDVGRRWLNDHPEFKAIDAPTPWMTNTGSRDERREDRRDERPRYRDERDAPYDPRYDDRGRQERSRGYDDRRPPAYDRDTRDRRDERPPSRDGSFLDRTRNHQGGYQDDLPPF
jgi:hypothetical protein